jgi:hypothetical protein
LHWPELLAKKQKGLPAAAKKSAPDNVVNLMGALRASLKSSGAPRAVTARNRRLPCADLRSGKFYFASWSKESPLSPEGKVRSVGSEYGQNVATFSLKERCTDGAGLTTEETIEFEALDALPPFDDSGNIAWVFEGEPTTRREKRWLELYLKKGFKSP